MGISCTRIIKFVQRPTSYALRTNVQSIHRSEVGATKVITPDVIEVWVTKTTGVSVENLDGYNAWEAESIKIFLTTYSTDGSIDSITQFTNPSKPISIADISDISHYVVGLYTAAASLSGNVISGGVLIDSATIHIVDDGSKGEKGDDGTSVTIKGTAIAHYPTYSIFQSEHSERGYYLVDDAEQAIVVNDSGTLLSQTATNGDGWIIGQDLWVCSGNVWNNVGQIKGEKGDDGNSITEVVNYYLATSLNGGVTIGTPGWTTSIQTISPIKRYLWNYEVVVICRPDGSAVSRKTTPPHIIGVYGSSGKGIASITEYYLASPASSGVTTATEGWTTAMQDMTLDNKYLWNFERTTWTDTTTTDSNPVIIGVRGDDGLSVTGPRGYAGAKHRSLNWDECEIGFQFYSGAGGEEFYDTITYKDSIYLCKKTHTKVETTPNNDDTNWEYATNWDIVATKVLLAKYASINFAEGNELKIYDNAERLKGGIVSIDGNYPLLFIHPRRTPLKVSPISFARSTTKETPPAASSFSETFPTVDSENRYLWVTIRIDLSDGTVEERVMCVYEYDTLSPNLCDIQFITKNEETSPDNNSDEWNAKLETPTEDNQYLYARLGLYQKANLLGIYIFYVGKYQASDDTTSALFQVRRDGGVHIGEYYGANLRLIPSYDESRGLLPRMEIADTDGRVASVFDGSSVYDTSELYDGESSSESMHSGCSVGATVPVGHSTTPINEHNSITIGNIYCGSAGIVSVGELHCSMSGTSGLYGGSSSTPRAHQFAVAGLWMGNMCLRQISIDFDIQTQASFTFPKMSVSVGEGFYKITLKVIVSGYSGANATCVINNTCIVRFDANKYISRYFANGLCLGSTKRNHFLVLNKDDKMHYEALSNGGSFNINNGSVGIAGDGNDFKIMRVGNWLQNQPLTIFNGYVHGLISGASFEKCCTWNGEMPNVSRTAKGVYEITYPNSWQGLGVSSNTAYALVSGFGNGATCTAQVAELTTTKLIIKLFYGTTSVDGSFFIEMKLY